jgi:hypothetical protein
VLYLHALALFYPELVAVYVYSSGVFYIALYCLLLTVATTRRGPTLICADFASYQAILIIPFSPHAAGILIKATYPARSHDGAAIERATASHSRPYQSGSRGLLDHRPTRSPLGGELQSPQRPRARKSTRYSSIQAGL